VRILLVEDSEDIGDAMASKLRLAGHAVEWLRDGDEAGEAVVRDSFDAIVLDINLPGRSGLAVLKAMRAAGVATPVIVVTARSEIDDKIGILDLGADDYLVKPFDLRELEARLRAMMRRRAGALASAVVIGELTIDHAAREVRLANALVELGRREFALLEILVSQLGQVIPKQRLMDRLFSLDEEVSENALELYVSRLRRKLQGAPLSIVTVRGTGYVARTHAS
jgi:two-component system, OmpR family, response regulator TctD